MLSLYSDASKMVTGTTAAASTIIIDDSDQFRALVTNIYHNVRSSDHAELLGVVQGLDWVCKNAPKEDIRIICDSLSIAERIAAYPQDRRVVSSPSASTWIHLFNLLDRLHPPLVAHIKAHQPTHNPNKACDVLCTWLTKHAEGGDL